MKNNNEKWTADVIVKKECEEYGLRPIFLGGNSQGNGTSGGNEENDHDNEPNTKNSTHKKVTPNRQDNLRTKRTFFLVIVGGMVVKKDTIKYELH